MNDVKSGLTDGVATPEILNETPATAWVDGKSALGPVVGNFCMDLAVQKAQNSGIGLVVAKGQLIAGYSDLEIMDGCFRFVSLRNRCVLHDPGCQ